MKTGIDVEDISIGIGLDKRIGSRFLRAGPPMVDMLQKILKQLFQRINLKLIYQHKKCIKSNEIRSDILQKRVNF